MRSSTTQMDQSFWEYHHAYEHRSIAWAHEVVFTWQWWFGIILTIIPWSCWFIFRKKESSDRLMYAGLFVCVISLTLDNIGFQLAAWTYHRPATPLIPAYIPFDFALMPVVIMFLIQNFHHRNRLLIGLIFGGFTAFVGEPFFRWIDIYQPVHWKSIYSLPIYTVIYIISHYLTLRKRFTPLS